MGSGERFRVTWLESRCFGFGVFVQLRGEHEVSIHIQLVKVSIYLGFGKGYEDFYHG